MNHPGCCRPCDGLRDISNGINCIIGGVSKTICCGVNALSCVGNALMAPVCPPRPHCRPRPHPPTCTCTCRCECNCR